MGRGLKIVLIVGLALGLMLPIYFSRKQVKSFLWENFSALPVPGSGPIDPKVTATKRSLVKITNAVNLYFKDCGHYPADPEELTRKYEGCRIAGKNKYLNEVPADAWGEALIYENKDSHFILRSKNFQDPEMSVQEMKRLHINPIDGPGGFDGN